MFDILGLQCVFKFFPAGDEESKPGDTAFYLSIQSSGKTDCYVAARFWVYCRTGDQWLLPKSQNTQEINYYNQVNSWGWSDFCSQKTLQEMGSLGRIAFKICLEVCEKVTTSIVFQGKSTAITWATPKLFFVFFFSKLDIFSVM